MGIPALRQAQGPVLHDPENPLILTSCFRTLVTLNIQSRAKPQSEHRNAKPILKILQSLNPDSDLWPGQIPNRSPLTVCRLPFAPFMRIDGDHEDNPYVVGEDANHGKHCVRR
jgi:hypothetical protein